MLSDVRSRSATSRVVKVKSGMVAIAGGRYLVATGSNRMGSESPGPSFRGLLRVLRDVRSSQNACEVSILSLHH